MQAEKVVYIAYLGSAREQHFNRFVRFAAMQALVNKQTNEFFEAAVAPGDLSDARRDTYKYERFFPPSVLVESHDRLLDYQLEVYVLHNSSCSLDFTLSATRLTFDEARVK